MPSLSPSGGSRPTCTCSHKSIKVISSFQLILFLLLCPSTSRLVYVESVLASGTYTLGFLSPSPGITIPASLATQWRSAFQVAVEVLNVNHSYNFVAHMEDSDCSFLPAKEGASRILQQDGLIGAVGPACSGAALGAAQVFDEKGPAALVSFAATAEPLSNRNFFPTFFRTVYTDKHQAKAVAVSMKRLNITNAILLYTKDYYSMSLANEINVTTGGVRMVLLEPGYNATVNKEQLKSLLNSLQPSDFVILVVQPTVAQDIWKMAFQMDKTRYPWWYFGTDGATAFDPSDIDPELTKALQGEIGLAPQGWDILQNAECRKFYMHWQEKAHKYPGLPALGANQSRSYVPYLFDAVMAFYVAVDNLQRNGLEITTLNVFNSFTARGKNQLRFNGCTGVVEFDPDTGARSITAQPPVYDLVSITAHSWELRGKIANESVITLLPLERPGNYSATGEEHRPGSNSHQNASAGLIAGIVFLVIAMIVLIVAFFVYFAKSPGSSVFNKL